MSDSAPITARFSDVPFWSECEVQCPVERKLLADRPNGAFDPLRKLATPARFLSSGLTNGWSMSKWLKPFLFGIWGLLLIPLIGTVLEKWLEENVFSEPYAVATTISDNLVAVGQLRWFKFALVLVTGIVIGVSLESLSRKSGERRAFELRSLGYKFRSLSESIKIQTAAPGWPDNARDLRPAITSAFISAKRFDLWAPSERVYELPDSSFLCEYFRCVGRLLEDGHLDEARREALSWKPFLDRAKTSYSRSL